MMRFLVVGSLLLSLAAAGPTLAQKSTPPRKVQDDAGLFSKEAEEKANAQIARFKRQYQKDLLIETVPAVERPSDVSKDEASKSKYFDTWASDRFKNLQVDGIYVVIVKNPHILRVVVGPNTRSQGFFTKDNEVHLEKELVADLKAAKYDLALAHAVDYVSESLGKHAPAANETPAAPPRQHSPPPQHDVELPAWMSFVCIGLAVLAGLWVIMAIARAFSGSSAPGVGGAGYASGGGGFFSSLLGGMFGAAAGMWMYNNFFGGQAHAGNYPPSGGGYSDPGAGNTDVGALGNPSVTGGDWGDTGGQGDGDTGGGDWGGGGGDFGGGGGGGGGDW